MAVILEGEYKYVERYVIECDGALYGPFDAMSDATDLAMVRLEPPWTLRVLLNPCNSERGDSV